MFGFLIRPILIAVFAYFGLKAYLTGGRRDWRHRAERGFSRWLFNRPFSGDDTLKVQP